MPRATDSFDQDRLASFPEARPQSAGNLRDRVDGLYGSYLFWRGLRPPTPYAPPEVAAVGSSGLAAHPGGLDAASTWVVDGPAGAPERSGTASLGLSRGVTAGVSTTGPEGRGEASAFIANGFGMVNGAWGSGAQTVNAGVAFMPTGLGLSAGTTFLDAAGVTRGASVFATGSARRQLQDLGPYDGTDPNLLGTRKVELKRRVGGAFLPSARAATAFLGLGGTVGVDRAKELVYRTHLSAARARQLLFERGGLRGLLRDTGRALGRVRDPLPMPALDQPEAMQVGDELRVGVSGTFQTVFAVGGPSVLALGVQGTVMGEFALAVVKTGPDTVELSVTPLRVKGVHAFAGMPWLLEGAVSKLNATSLRQSFQFDLRRPEALEAYRAALRGELPGAGGDASMEGSASQVLSWMRNQALPPGVRRTYLERIDIAANAQGGGVKWGPLHSFSPLGGLQVLQRREAEELLMSDGCAALASSGQLSERRTEAPLSGTARLGVGARVRSLTSAGDGWVERDFLGVTLTARYADNKVRGLELNGHIRRMNRLFGTHLGDLHRARKQKDWEVTFERTLSPADLAQMTDVPAERRARAAAATGVPTQALEALFAQLQACADVEARAKKLQAFVDAHGLEGFAALHRVCEGIGAPLLVQSLNSAYEAAWSTAELLQFKYPEPMVPGDEPAALVQRFEEVHQALKAVRRAALELEDDPLLTDAQERERVAQRLKAAERALPKLYALHHFPQEALRELEAAVSEGWRSGPKARLLAHLEVTRRSR